MDRWSTSVDLYCERTDPSFWSEPFNAVTNAAFLIAAAVAFLEWRRAERDWPVLALIVLTALVGAGSFIFHTVATRGAALFDKIPIALFIYSYLFVALRRFLAVGLTASLVIVGAFIAASHGLGALVPRGFMNGSYNYLPALGALVVIDAIAPPSAARRLLLAAAAIFALSLAFRTMDIVVCSGLPLGTHFLWHSLNGVVLYLLLRAAASAAPQPAARA